jgi:competence protein ComEC
MRFSDYPFLRYVPFLLIGIYIGSLAEFPVTNLVFILSLIGLIYAIIVVYFIKKVNGFYRSILGYLMLLVFGVLLSATNQKNDKKDIWEGSEGYIAEVTLYDQEKPNSFENLLEIKSINQSGNWVNTNGKVLIYHQMNLSLEPGMILCVQDFPEEVDSPSNP